MNSAYAYHIIREEALFIRGNVEYWEYFHKKYDGNISNILDVVNECIKLNTTDDKIATTNYYVYVQPTKRTKKNFKQVLIDYNNNSFKFLKK